MAEAFQPVGLGEHVHGMERLDIAASGQGQRHRRTPLTPAEAAAPHKCPNDMGITSS